MATFAYKTKGNASPAGKPRVYFTCHPADYARYLDKLCDDVFKTHDCAIYYTEDMTEPLDEDNLEADLGQMNLFIVPVTFRLLTEPCRAMSVDLAYAKQHKIPILPFMMESDIDHIYKKPENFGERQYLNPFGTDASEIRYEDKLKRYLETVLIGDETAQRVRDAFDAYVFLSYRKKDRRYANQLMHLIHQIPEYRDVAIWYDEFLTPGESFRQNIEKALGKSKLFTLLVTPNLLEDPNYVMSTEYPAAKESGIPILPAEMLETDKHQLGDKYNGIPDCINAQNDADLRAGLAEMLDRIAKTENDNDPEHNFLIGLAYLDGIDVEVDRKRALELITSAAEADLPEAMEKLIELYENGVGVDLDYREAFKWAEKLVTCYERMYGPEHSSTLMALNSFANSCMDAGMYEQALPVAKKVYHLRCKMLGEEHPDTLTSLNNLAQAYGYLGERQKANELHEKAYSLHCKVLGEEHRNTLVSLNNLALSYADLSFWPIAEDLQKSKELHEKAYNIQCRVLGEEHPDTLLSLQNLATIHVRLFEYQKAKELIGIAYRMNCKVLGEEHPRTLSALESLAIACSKLNEGEKAIEFLEEAYRLHCKVLGERHPHTLRVLENLEVTCLQFGEHQKAIEYRLYREMWSKKPLDALKEFNALIDMYWQLGEYLKVAELQEKKYGLLCKVLGEEHPDTVHVLGELSITYFELGEYQTATEHQEKVYRLYCKKLGKKHPDTIAALEILAYIYEKTGENQRAKDLEEEARLLRSQLQVKEDPDSLSSNNDLDIACSDLFVYERSQIKPLMEKEYRLRCKTLGEEHPDTVRVLGCLAAKYDYLREFNLAKEFYEKLYRLRCKMRGEEHPDTIAALESLARVYEQLDDYRTALELYEKIFTLKCVAFGELRFDTLNTLNYIAWRNDWLGNHQKALEAQEKLYALSCEAYGKDDFATVSAWERLQEYRRKAE